MPAQSRRIAPLHYRRMWLFIGVSLLMLLIYGSLAPAAVLPPLGESDKFWHGATYFVVMAYLSQLYAGVRARALIGAGLLGMGIAIEFIQPYVNRQFDWFDAFSNGIGVFVALGISFSPFDQVVT